MLLQKEWECYKRGGGEELMSHSGREGFRGISTPGEKT